jgi:predicted MFS family arabinose efflux permease
MLHATARTYRNAYSGLSRETWLLSLIMLINRSGTMVIPFITLYLTTQMGFSIKQAGIVFGLFGLGAFSGAWLGGKLTDRIGFHAVQMITLFGGGILFFVLGHMKTYDEIRIVTYLLGFVNEAFRPANSTAIAFYSKEENRTRSYALNRLAINLGWALGSGIGGVLAHRNYELLFWVDGFTNIGAAFLILFLLRSPGNKPISIKKMKNDDPLVRSVFKDGTYLLFAIVTMLFASCFFQIFTNIPVFFKKEMNFSEQFIGALMATNGIIIAILEMVLIYKLERRRPNLFFISIGVFTVGISFLILNAPGPAVLIASSMIVLVTFGEILSMPFMNSYWIARTQAGNRGEYAALYTMAWSAAQTAGPMIGAWVADTQGFETLWWAVGTVSIIAALCFRRLKT